MRLALHIIAKDEVDQLSRIIRDYSEYFAEIAIAYDGDVKPLYERFKLFPHVKFYEYKWINDFSDKRNFLASKTESDYYFRLDTDDIIKNPEKIQEVFADVVNKSIDVVYMEYLYERDSDGNCIAKHWRETIVRKSKNIKWDKTVHETLKIDNMNEFVGVKDHRVSIIHDTDENHTERSAMRNFKILKAEFEKDKEKTDPRTLAYLGRMFLGVGEYRKSISFLELLVQRSGWDEDKYFAYCEMGHAWSQLGDNERAIACCNEALSLNTEYPDAYHELAQIYVLKKDYDKAIHWGLIGLQKKIPDTLTVVDPTKYSYRALMNIAIALFHKGDFKVAKQYFDKAYELAPNETFIKEQKPLFENALENKEYMDRLVWLVKYTNDKEPEKVESLVKSIPSNMLRDERVHSLRNRFLTPKKWSDKSLVIYCYDTVFEWAPPSVVTGIGGSEEAVIYLSKELTKLGHEVTVFCNCGELKGTYEGVTYKEFFEFNSKDHFNNLISWRQNIFHNNIKAKNKIVWLHDVVNKDWFYDTDVDRVIVLSEFHKSLIDEALPEDKIFVSKNGINLPDFIRNGVLREPNRMIYTSSYDRGIEHLLNMWGDVRKEVPDAELHLFYGWDTYDAFVDMGMRTTEFKDKMVKLMEQDGIHEHGRIGHKRLVKEFQKSKFFVYPSHFEEISCISAMKAQACGCVPVVTDFAALKETVKDGVIVKGCLNNKDTYEEYKEALIKALKEQPEINVDKEQFSWETVAKQWDKELLHGLVRNIH